jgi:hypothetical protein
MEQWRVGWYKTWDKVKGPGGMKEETLRQIAAYCDLTVS